MLYADNATTPGIHLGFNLNIDGESLSLYDRPANGGALLDRVSFGLQLTDWSIGRAGEGNWALTIPTFGAANKAALVGDPHHLQVNEWLAADVYAFSSDFFELFNPEAVPILTAAQLVAASPRPGVAPVAETPDAQPSPRSSCRPGRGAPASGRGTLSVA